MKGLHKSTCKMQRPLAAMLTPTVEAPAPGYSNRAQPTRVPPMLPASKQSGPDLGEPRWRVFLAHRPPLPHATCTRRKVRHAPNPGDPGRPGRCRRRHGKCSLFVADRLSRWWLPRMPRSAPGSASPAQARRSEEIVLAVGASVHHVPHGIPGSSCGRGSSAPQDAASNGSDYFVDVCCRRATRWRARDCHQYDAPGGSPSGQSLHGRPSGKSGHVGYAAESGSKLKH
ncbi:hypothetical protein ACVWWK_002628 [Bradyrhizobium sp. LB9.1b]